MSEQIVGFGTIVMSGAALAALRRALDSDWHACGRGGLALEGFRLVEIGQFEEFRHVTLDGRGVQISITHDKIVPKYMVSVATGSSGRTIFAHEVDDLIAGLGGLVAEAEMNR